MKLGLGCLFLPGGLLLVLIPYYYASKRAEFSINNLTGAFGLSVVYPVYVWVFPVHLIFLCFEGKSDVVYRLWTQQFMMFIMSE